MKAVFNVLLVLVLIFSGVTFQGAYSNVKAQSTPPGEVDATEIPKVAPMPAVEGEMFYEGWYHVDIGLMKGHDIRMQGKLHTKLYHSKKTGSYSLKIVQQQTVAGQVIDGQIVVIYEPNKKGHLNLKRSWSSVKLGGKQMMTTLVNVKKTQIFKELWQEMNVQTMQPLESTSYTTKTVARPKVDILLDEVAYGHFLPILFKKNGKYRQVPTVWPHVPGHLGDMDIKADLTRRDGENEGELVFDSELSTNEEVRYRYDKEGRLLSYETELGGLVKTTPPEDEVK